MSLKEGWIESDSDKDLSILEKEYSTKYNVRVRKTPAVGAGKNEGGELCTEMERSSG